ncbi:MAG: hypothetical protein EOM35_02205 [Negativicutes bacterium]|nr:hypothetical protein [Negativicutes bacterium]
MLLELNESLRYTNVDSDKGALTSIKDYTSLNQRIDRWFHKFKGSWYSSTINREYLEYRDLLYWTEKDNYPKKICNGIEKKVGIEAPTAALTLAAVTSADVDIHGTLQYTYTFYDSVLGVESAPAPLSAELAVIEGKRVDLSGFQTSGYCSVDKIRIYRLGADTTEFVLIDTIDNGTATYSDSIDPLDAPGNILDSYLNTPPLLGIRYLIEAYGILFAAYGDTLVYSSIGKPDYWPSSNSIPIAGKITGLYAISDGIIIFTLTRTYLLLGTSSADFALTPLSPEHGCLDHLSIAFVRNSLMWAAAQGLCLLISGSVVVASKDKLGLIKLSPVKAVSYDEQYMLVQTDGSVFIADFKTGSPVFKTLQYVKANVYNLGVFDNILYGSVDDQLVDLFTGELIELQYLSPRLTDGDATVTKMYNNIYVRAEGEFTFNVLIDGKQVLSNKLLGDKLYDITVPQELQRGSDIQFDIKGVGSIKEIEYKVVGRNNGR